MTTEVELKSLMESTQKAVDSMREKAEQEAHEIKKFGVAQEETKTSLAKQQKDIDALIDAIAEVKKNQMFAAEHKGVQLSQAEMEQKAAFGQLMRKGENAVEQKALSTLSNPDGGYFVPRDTSGRIIKKVQDFSPMRRYASVQMISSDALEGLIDNQNVAGGWVGETETRQATATPKVGMWKIPVHEIYCNPQATQRMLDDSEINPEAWLIDKVSQYFARSEADAFINGNGVGKPMGLLSRTLATTTDASRAWGTVQKVKTGVSGGFAVTPNGGDALIDLITALHPKYWAGAIFAMNRYTLGEVRKLKDSDGNYIWSPDFTTAPSGTILGMGVDSSFDHLPNIGAGSKSIIFGNLRESYQIVDRKGMTILRDPFTNKPFVGFYTTMRVGGDVINSEAYKVLTFEA